MLTLKEDKHSGDVILTGVDRTHNTYTDFRCYSLASTAAGAEAASASGAAGAGTAGTIVGPSSERAAASASGAAAARSLVELLVEELYKPGKELRPVFEALGVQHEALMTEKEVGEVGVAYVKAAKLDDGVADQRNILLDVTLCDALFKVCSGELGALEKRVGVDGGECCGEMHLTIVGRSCLMSRCVTRCSRSAVSDDGRKRVGVGGGGLTKEVVLLARRILLYACHAA